MKFQKETLGSFFIFFSSFIWSLFPIVVNQGTKTIPPLAFAGLSTLTVAVCSVFFLFPRQRYSELKERKSYFYLFMLTLCIIIIPYSLFFIGSKHTSGINSAFLLLMEVIFTLIFTHFIGEKTTWLKLLGSLGVFIGACFIVLQKAFVPTLGDILIVASTAVYPIGNFYSKVALRYTSIPTILFFRSFLGGFFILGLSFIFERPNLTQILFDHWKIILLNGMVILGLSKLFWYKGLRSLDISKAISLSIIAPFFSLLFLVLFFKEPVSLFQAIGIAIMMVGMYFSLTRKSVQASATKYGK